VEILGFDVHANGELIIVFTYLFTAVPAMVFYSLARIFIVVESFIGLRRVPIGVYWTPAWLQMIPHF